MEPSNFAALGCETTAQWCPLLYRFEGCTLDLTRGCLEVAGREVELRPKCFDLLRHLVENGNRLISKEELAAAAWPQVVVTDESLARCISDVRAAIADHEHKIIKTMPRRGYLQISPAMSTPSLDSGRAA